MTGPAWTEIAIDPRLTAGRQPEDRHLGGLLALVREAERPFPLRKVRVRASIAGDCCRTIVDQSFDNPYDVTLEAHYIFPLPPRGALLDMEIVAGDRTIRAECRPRREAEEAFRHARSRGHRAALLVQERADVYSVTVTNLPARTGVAVRFTIVERLEYADGRFTWRFPTVVAPRFLPGNPMSHDGPGTLPATDRVPDASALQPPILLGSGASLDLEVDLCGPMAEIASSMHAVRLSVADAGERWRVVPSARATLDRDFVLAFRTADTAVSTARAWSDGAHSLVVVEPPADVTAPTLPRDAVFVIDRSGSMSGLKMEAAKLALATAVHGLAPGDRFGLIAFDHEVWPFDGGRLSDYTDLSLERADAWIAELHARGGTEMLAPLELALGSAGEGGRILTVLLITDGEVWNETELVAAVARHRGRARLFAMGIDTVSGSLLARLASVGGGTSQMLAPTDDIETEVARLEARMGSPVLDDVKVLGGQPADPSPRVLFAGQAIGALLEGAPEEVEVSGRAAGGPWTTSATVRRIDFRLGPLWARERIAALEDAIAIDPSSAEGLERQILEVASSHQIASRCTSFVAVDTTVGSTGEVVRVVQPVELPHLWQSEECAQLRCAAPPSLVGKSSPSIERRHSAMVASGLPTGAADILAEYPFFARPTVRSTGVTKPTEPTPVPGSSLEADVARRQAADGSVGPKATETAAALAVLVLLGHTRRAGVRRRVVAKAAAWLALHADEPGAFLALELLRLAEAGSAPRDLMRDHWDALAALPGFLELAGAAGARLERPE